MSSENKKRSELIFPVVEEEMGMKEFEEVFARLKKEIEEKGKILKERYSEFQIELGELEKIFRSLESYNNNPETIDMDTESVSRTIKDFVSKANVLMSKIEKTVSEKSGEKKDKKIETAESVFAKEIVELGNSLGLKVELTDPGSFDSENYEEIKNRVREIKNIISKLDYKFKGNIYLYPKVDDSFFDEKDIYLSIERDDWKEDLGKALEKGTKGQIIEVYIQKNIKGK